MNLLLFFSGQFFCTIVCRPSNDRNNFFSTVRHKQYLISSSFPDDHAYIKWFLSDLIPRHYWVKQKIIRITLLSYHTHIYWSNDVWWKKKYSYLYTKLYELMNEWMNEKDIYIEAYLTWRLIYTKKFHSNIKISTINRWFHQWEYKKNSYESYLKKLLTHIIYL